MQLEKLEITNFKSYRGTYTVGPFDRFTSVIGPNGSGKSNLLDAIIFAMNVPTSSLRAKSIGELVTRGEDGCSVKVYLCGRVFERQLTAGGGSVYLCDGTRVSASAYTEQLEALNVFGKIKNFVICQGDIIRSDVDLLQMIEHVCGSSAHVADYRRLEGELAAANKELSLKYEKKKGYFEYLKEVKEGKQRETALNRLVEQRDALQRQIYTIGIRNKRSEIARVKVEMEELKESAGRHGHGAKIQEINAIRAETVRLQKEYFERESELVFLKGKPRSGGDLYLKEKREELAGLEAEYRQIEGALKHHETSAMMGSLESVSAFEHRLRSASDAIAEKEDFYRSAVGKEERRLAELTLANFDKISRQEQLRASKKNISSKLAKLVQRQQREKAEEEARASRRLALGQEMASLKKKIEDKEEKYDQILADEARLNSELSSVVRSILLNKARKSDAVRRSAISNVVENLKGIFSGVHGKVIDLIAPIQKKYELSIGVLLSSYDLAVVVDNETVALDCVRYLKESKACKLTFLPVSMLRAAGRQRDAECTNNGESVRPARRCVRYDPKYSSVVEFIFRNSLIVDSVSRARSIAYRERYPGSICTLDGLLMTSSGIITGGRETKNKFDENAIDKLLARRAAILADLGIVKDRKEAFADIQAVRDRIADLGRQVEEIGAGAGGCCTTAEELGSLQNEYLAVCRSLDAVDAELQDFERQKGEIKAFMKAAEKDIFSELLKKLGLEMLSEYRSRLYEVGDVKGRYLRLKALGDDIKALKEEIGVLSAPQHDAGSSDLTKLEQEVRSLYNMLEQSKSRLRSESAAMRNVTCQRDEINRRILNGELLKAKLEEELKDLRNYILIECGITTDEGGEVLGGGGVGSAACGAENLSNSEAHGGESGHDAQCSPCDEEGLESLHAKLHAINRSIEESIPPVTAHDGTARSRYALFNKEYAEAKEHAAELRRHFYEIKQARMAVFSECFTFVAREIAAIYRALCGGGEGEGNAYIVYEGDPFVNNLKYYLMPPAKRFTEFKELSGGEKSLALLSFIFALNSYRKAPFYVFDEVDSALDKANVERLVSYMKGSSEQFLVISLKQRVFEHSDALVGVYRCPREDRSRILTYRLKSEK